MFTLNNFYKSKEWLDLLETTLKNSKDGDIYINYTPFHDHLEKRNLFFFYAKK